MTTIEQELETTSTSLKQKSALLFLQVPLNQEWHGN